MASLSRRAGKVGSRRAFLVEHVRRIDARPVALVVGALFVAFAVFGTVQAVIGPIQAEGDPAPTGLGWVFYLDGEYTLTALFTASLLAAAGGIGLLAGWRWLGAGLLLMGADEALSLHERLEGWTDLDWQLLYVPVVAALAVAWAVVLRRSPRVGQRLLVAAALAWAVSQTLEELQWNGAEPVDGYRAMMVVEELLEIAGSAAFLFAALAAIRSVAAR